MYWSDLDPEGPAFLYDDADWARLVYVYGDAGQLIHPRMERGGHDVGAGSVLARHFRGVLAAKEISTEMQVGLKALYERNDAVEAITRFRNVLARNPDHYGGTLQLAKALDQAGRTEEALPIWRRMREMAEQAGDVSTLETVRIRLSREK